MKLILSPAIILISFVKIYKTFVSPLFPPSCRYYPTCSAYTIDALTKYGATKGLYLGFKRILRCHPWSKGGFDPIP